MAQSHVNHTSSRPIQLGHGHAGSYLLAGRRSSGEGLNCSSAAAYQVYHLPDVVPRISNYTAIWQAKDGQW